MVDAREGERAETVSGGVEEGGRGEGREARGGERAAAGQGVGDQRHAGALSTFFSILLFTRSNLKPRTLPEPRAHRK